MRLSADASTKFNFQSTEGQVQSHLKGFIANLFRCDSNLGGTNAFAFFVNVCRDIHSHFSEIKF